MGSGRLYSFNYAPDLYMVRPTGEIVRVTKAMGIKDCRTGNERTWYPSYGALVFTRPRADFDIKQRRGYSFGGGCLCSGGSAVSDRSPLLQLFQQR